MAFEDGIFIMVLVVYLLDNDPVACSNDTKMLWSNAILS